MPDSERDSRNSGNPDRALPGRGIKSSMAQKTTVFEERKWPPGWKGNCIGNPAYEKRDGGRLSTFRRLRGAFVMGLAAGLGGGCRCWWLNIRLRNAQIPADRVLADLVDHEFFRLMGA